MLFLQSHIHIETAVRALRLLVHILSEPIMYTKFKEGDLAGRWLEGSEQFLLETGSEEGGGLWVCSVDTHLTLRIWAPKGKRHFFP